MSLNIPKPDYTPPMPKVEPAMSNYELKPCPFCGNTPEASVTVEPVTIRDNCMALQIYCSACRTSKRYIVHPGTSFLLLSKQMSAIIKDWNRRE